LLGRGLSADGSVPGYVINLTKSMKVIEGNDSGGPLQGLS